MEGLLEKFRCAWTNATSYDVSDFISGFECGGLHDRCRGPRAEQAAGMGLMPTGTSSASNSMYYYPSASAPAQFLDQKTYAEESRSSEAALGATAPHAQEGPRAEAGEDEGEHPAQQASARSCESADSGMASADRDREKARLQRMLKDFAKEAVAGIVVSLVNPRTGRKPPYFMQMDRHLTMLSLRPKDGSTAESAIQDFSVTDIASIYKGHEVFVRAPCLGKEAVGCVGLDMELADCTLIFHFDDAYDRDKFYTSMQVLSLSAGIQQSR